MSSTLKLVLTILAQALAQGAILAVIPSTIQPYIQALAVLVGIVLAYNDPTATIAKLGMGREQYKAQLAQKNPLNH
jgi:hypothetical protein